MYKLQLITEAKKICPDVVIVLGENLTRFRNASKQLYAFLSSFSWNSRCERLGFDEVWLDVSDLVDSNVASLNLANLSESFFRLSKHDPAVGFSFDATDYAGPVHPETSNETHGERLLLSYDVQIAWHTCLCFWNTPETCSVANGPGFDSWSLCCLPALCPVLMIHVCIVKVLFLHVSCFMILRLDIRLTSIDSDQCR